MPDAWTQFGIILRGRKAPPLPPPPPPSPLKKEYICEKKIQCPFLCPFSWAVDELSVFNLVSDLDSGGKTKQGSGVLPTISWLSVTHSLLANVGAKIMLR
jgi:hypothetical protein